MNDNPFLATLFFFGPTPVAALLAGYLGLKTRTPWRAFAVGTAGTIAFAVALGAAAEQAPVWGSGYSVISLWMYHLLLSPFFAVPVGTFCAARVAKRRSPTAPHEE